MLAGNAKRIFKPLINVNKGLLKAIMSHALEQMKAAGIGDICQSSSSKLPTSCLHGYSASLHKLHGSTFFWEAIKEINHDCPGRNNSHFGLENEGWKMSCVLSVRHLPWVFSFQTWCGDFPFGKVSRTLLSKQSTSPDVNTAKHARSLRKVEEDKSLCVVFLQCSEIESGCLEIFQSQFGNPRMSPFEFLADRRNKTLERWLAPLNVSCAIMSHSLISFQAARIGVICQSSSSKLSTSCLHGYSASLHKLHGSTFFWKAIFVTPTIVLAGTIHTLAWKMRVEKCHLSFGYGILPGSFPFQTWYGDFQFWGCISIRTLSSHESNSLDVNTAKNARSRGKDEGDKVTLCDVWCSCNVQNRKWLLWDLPISVRKSTNIARWVLIRHYFLIEK